VGYVNTILELTDVRILTLQESIDNKSFKTTIVKNGSA
jgi:hypothetical protein